MTKVILISNTDWYLFRFRWSLAQYLREEGVEVAFLSPPGPYASRIQSAGFRWLEWNVSRQGIQPWAEMKSIWKLRQILRREAPDLVHLHTIKPVLYGSLALWSNRRVAIVRSITGRGYVFLGSDMRARLLRWLVRWGYRLLLHSGRGVTVFENQTDQAFFVSEGLVDPANTVIIEGVGVNTEEYLPLAEPEGDPVVVLAGRLLRDKGVEIFVDAARQLRGKVRARFVLVGGPDAGNPSSISVEMLNSWVREGVIEWWGWQSDMQEVFARCHIVCLPSFGEGIPTVLLEAASSARPIVATDVPGCRDVVADGVNGFLVPPGDAVALAQALERLIREPHTRQRMGQAGRERVNQRFSAKIVNRATYQVYQQLLERG